MILKRGHKRIFYRPGMISLVFIPLLCLFHFCKTDAFKVYSSFSFSYIEDSVFIKKGVPDLRQYKEFCFNNSELSEQNKFKDLVASLRKLKNEHDTINGVKINFGKHTNYAVFIKILNILTIEDMPIYIPYKNDIWVIVPPKPNPSKYRKIIPLRTCGNYEANKENWLEMEQKAEWEKQYSFFKQQWILFLAYFGMVLLNVFALRKFNKNQKVS